MQPGTYKHIADYAEGIARYVVEFNLSFNKNILQGTQLLVMMDKTINMMEDAIKKPLKKKIPSWRAAFFKRMKTWIS